MFGKAVCLGGLVAAVALVAVRGSAIYGAGQPPRTGEAAFAQFWAAETETAAAAAAKGVAESGMAFDAVFNRLRNGRSYTSDVRRGVVPLKQHLGPYDFNYLVEVPKDYDPGRK